MDKHFPLIVVGIFIFQLVVLGGIGACQDSNPEELKARAAERAIEGLVTVSPRPGVECYILGGVSSTNPRAMSCVVIPR